MRLRQRWRRTRFVVGVKVTARRAGGHVDLDLAPDLVLGRDITVTVMHGTSSVVRMGPGCTIDDRVLLMLKGGSLEAGSRVDLRRDVVINLAGRLRLDGNNPVSWNSVIHCSNDIHLEEMAGIAEQVTIADSSHYFTTPDQHFWHNVKLGAVRVGRNTWICPKVTLTRTADVGSHCIVGAGSVVVGTIPDGHLASGVPATSSPLPLPWATARKRAGRT